MIKRLFDILCALGGIFILSPLFIIIMLVIKVTSRGDVFFRQARVGKNEKIFRIHKFRTMVTNAEAHGLKITVGRDPRITRIGYLLRKTKLDEIPQLIDVLFGNMSLVGPRPEVPEYTQFYPPEIRKKVFSVRPGITDEASIVMIDENDILSKSSNPEQTYIQEILPLKLSYAVKYVDSHNLLLDISLIVKTVMKIFTR